VESIYKKKRGTYPVPGVTWGEEGLEEVTYLGTLPFAAIGDVTNNRYKWSKVKPMRLVDKRDLPGIIKSGGKKKFAVKKDEEKVVAAPAEILQEAKNVIE